MVFLHKFHLRTLFFEVVEGIFVIGSHTRGACQSLEVDCYLPALGLRILLHFVKQYFTSPQHSTVRTSLVLL
jgi:hypothetical protein